MSTATLTTIVEPLVKRRLFATTEEAVLELMQDYTFRQISSYQRQIAELERRYGMNFTKFTQYLRERGAMLQSRELSPQQRQSLGRALMAEEDDWLDWKVATEMLQSWLGLREEGAARDGKVLESADRYQEIKSQPHDLELAAWRVANVLASSF